VLCVHALIDTCTIHSRLFSCVQLKTVMERCEKGKPELLDRVRSMRTKGGYVERLTADKHFCLPLSTTAADSVDLKSAQLTQAQLEKYSRAYDDSPHVSPLENISRSDGLCIIFFGFFMKIFLFFSARNRRVLKLFRR